MSEFDHDPSKGERESDLPSDLSGNPETRPNAFCRFCGMSMNGQLTCSICSGREVGVIKASRADKSSGGSVKSAIWMYFVLLSTFGIIFFDPENVVLGITVGVVDAFIVLAWCIYHRQQIVPRLRLPNRAVFWLVGGLLAGCLTYAVTHVFIALMVAVFDLPVISYSQPFFENGYGLAALILMVVVQPAIVEEFAFRGVVFQALRGPLTLTEAMLVSSLMFAALHLSPLAFPHTFLIGIVSVVMVYQSHSIWPGVSLHFAHNSMAIAAELLLTEPLDFWI